MPLDIIAVIVLSFSFLLPPVSWAQPSAPVVSRQGEGYELKLPAAIKETLARFNPRFQPWQAIDYAPEVRHGAHQEKLKNRAPFALVTDVNGDGKDDLILDGHDDQQSLLLGVLSKGANYEVLILRTAELVDPQSLECQFAGEKQQGFAYYLWLSENQNADAPIFTLAWPQQSNAAGELLNDGGTIDYYFKAGRFEAEESQPL